MNRLRIRLIHIHQCRGITRRTIRKFIRYDPTLESIYKLSSTQISQLFSITTRNASLFYNDLHQQDNTQFKDNLKTYKIITVVDDCYPYVLKTIKDAPLVLYAMGNTDLLNKIPTISVIGTRKPSQDAALKMVKYVLPLIKREWVIVSGMATGIDSLAHQLALKNNGKTIAVLGSGFKHIYPKHNTHLSHQIVQHGLVLSEYPPDTPPERYRFPERNRLISGLSFGTLVIEATEKSGTLITVDQALDQGREVYAVPGSPLIPQTRGCHKMIQDGAKLVLDVEDILEDWDILSSNWCI
ncbi:DNA-processing protein DprA [Virgibacillus kekensis]|uniref:DNA-processing protein DprA n=1 Tax=Virgibacillus kekensis TaxID=202261 RepID=A0ABV9DFJ4_9BACI